MDARRSSGLDFNTVAAALLRSEYRFAKTMPDQPHWYTLRERWWQTEDWEAVVQFIRDVGYREKYSKTWYIKLDVNGMKYWTMGDKLPNTILINRAYVETLYPYDRIAPLYDQLMEVEDHQQLLDLLPRELWSNPHGMDVLDVGCGTGQLWDLLPEGVSYVGIDPSRGMLERFLQKHPALRNTERINAALSPLPDWIIPTTLGSYCPVDRRFDLAVALRGSASYCTTEELWRIPAMLKPGGRYVLTMYAEGTEPRVQRESGVLAPTYAHPEDVLPGTWSTAGEYRVLEGRVP